ncbi:EAL domain-containing protein [Francisellaceae bacterium]|nr:EAL domain-containing protein [Francisellaceae bacterium]
MDNLNRGIFDLVSDKCAKDLGIENLNELLHIIRRYFDMDVAFISRFSGDDLLFDYVDKKNESLPIEENTKSELCQSYCKKIVDGELSELTNDAPHDEIAKNLPATSKLAIGSYIGIPIILPNGKVHGTFCCFKHEIDHHLTKRDVSLVKEFADLSAKIIYKNEQESRIHQEVYSKISNIIDNEQMSTVYQPIFNLKKRMITGFESLTRFKISPYQTPGVIFSQANQIKLGFELELMAISTAIKNFNVYSEQYYLLINISPEHLLQDKLIDALRMHDLSKIVIEITEHAIISDYEELTDHIKILKHLGAKIAIDDAGNGYASFNHIIQLNADIIKLDLTLIRNIDKNKRQKALVAALIAFAKVTNCQVIAEGVETLTELKEILNLGANIVQGYFISKPLPLKEIDIHKIEQSLVY